MYAIISSGGKQYRVQEGDELNLEKLEAAEGDVVEVKEVLALSDEAGNFQVGTPYVSGAKVLLKVLEHGRGEKILVFKYKPKKRYRRKYGHRQPYTRVRVEKIEARG